MARKRGKKSRKNKGLSSRQRQGNSQGKKRGKRPEQQRLEFRLRGGRRKGAGRKPKEAKAGVPHVRRETVTPREPVHVTMRVAKGIWNLQRGRLSEEVLQALGDARQRLGVRLTQFSVQANHIHLIVEARDTPSLSRAMKGLAVRLARRINQVMGRKGPVFPDRYHAHVLRSPTQALNAARYVRDNSKRHAAQIGKRWRWEKDPYAAGPCAQTFLDSLRSLVVAPRAWVLQWAWAQLGRAAG